MKIFPSRLVFGALLLGGCGFYAGPPQTELDADLRKRAAFDLGCAESAIVVSPLSKPNEVGIVTLQGASGCSKKATYVMKSEGTKAVWIMNSNATEAPPNR